MIIWMTGLSGSGKTTLGKALYQQLKQQNPATVLLDGDQIREVFIHDRHPDAYTLDGRRISAERLHSLCALLDQQGIDVICCAISMFPDITVKNQTIFSRFFEIHMDVPLDVLASRDNKGLYQAALRGEIQNVVGVDLPYPSPSTPDMVIQNTFLQQDLKKYLEAILTRLGESPS